MPAQHRYVCDGCGFKEEWRLHHQEPAKWTEHWANLPGDTGRARMHSIYCDACWDAMHAALNARPKVPA